MRQEAYAIDSLFSTYREYIKRLPPDRLLRTHPRFAPGKCGRISDFIVSLSSTSYMRGVFILI